MKYALVVALLLCSPGLANAQARHRCADDAIAKAKPLMTLHFDQGRGEKVENLHVDEKVNVRPPIKALKGKGKFDVLEVEGMIYRAAYRMRFIYAQLRDSCTLLGQEILERSDPY